MVALAALAMTVARVGAADSLVTEPIDVYLIVGESMQRCDRGSALGTAFREVHKDRKRGTQGTAGRRCVPSYEPRILDNAARQCALPGKH